MVPVAVASPPTVPLPAMLPVVDFALPLTFAGLLIVTVPLRPQVTLDLAVVRKVAEPFGT